MVINNIVQNSDFNDVLVKNWGTTSSSDANRGWLVPNNHKWNLNTTDNFVYADNSGAGGITQVINNNSLNQGLQDISFDAFNSGQNTLRVQIFGINSEFKLGNWDTKKPQSLDNKTIDYVTLLDTDNIANQEFSWQNFSEQVDFEDGYQYIAIRVFTNNVSNSDSMGIDNFAIADSDLSSNNDPPISNDSTLGIGTNLYGIRYWSPQHPFIDIFKTARTWVTQAPGVFGTKESHLLDVDANGWVKSLPSAGDDVNYETIYTSINVDDNSGGKYHVLYDGEGTIQYSGEAKLVSSDPINGVDIINVTPANKNIKIKITEIDPKNNGNYLRNIRIVPEQDVNTYQEDIFNPAFLNHIKKFDTLRFMDWMETNHSEQGEWQDRPSTDDYTYFHAGSVPVEVMVELANQNGSNPWFTMPHQATDEYVQNFARYVRDNLDPSLNVYVEYSNEVWNSIFDQYHWVKEQALNEGLTRNEWYNKRTTEITRMWDNVFGAEKERVIGVMAAQGANVWIGETVLSYSWDSNPLSHEEYGIDAVAIAPYFGNYIGKEPNTSKLLSWSKEADGGLSKIFDEINNGGNFANSPDGGALQRTFDNMNNYADLAETEGLKLIAYEGGQHLVSHNKNSTVIDLFAQANRDPRMEEVYEQYFQEWFNIGGEEFMNFTDVSLYNQHGYWGLSETLNQDSPKYNAVMDFIDGLGD